MAIPGVKNMVNTYPTATNNTSPRIPGSNKLSDTAKSYIYDKLQKNNPEAKITIVDFESKEQKLNYMFGSGGTDNVAISADFVKQMAENPDIAAKYEKRISESLPRMAESAKLCEEQTGCTILGGGMVIDKNGKVSYWGVGIRYKEAGETLGTKYRKEMQEQIDERRAEKKAEAKKAEKRAEKKAAEKEKNVSIAESVLELQEKMIKDMKISQENPINDFGGQKKNGKVDVFI